MVNITVECKYGCGRRPNTKGAFPHYKKHERNGDPIVLALEDDKTDLRIEEEQEQPENKPSRKKQPPPLEQPSIHTFHTSGGSDCACGCRGFEAQRPNPRDGGRRYPNEDHRLHGCRNISS